MLFWLQQESLTQNNSSKNDVSTCLCVCKFPHSFSLWSFLSLGSTRFHQIFAWSSSNLFDEKKEKKKKNTSKFWFILFFLSRQIKLQLSHWLTALYIRANLFIACGCLFSPATCWRRPSIVAGFLSLARTLPIEGVNTVLTWESTQ